MQAICIKYLRYFLIIYRQKKPAIAGRLSLLVILYVYY